ncbi:MAG: hypothetical protein NTX40_08040 [Planctomycetota bacterium]|nr:hypothetical protein [Planctomycetota bacterium]
MTTEERLENLERELARAKRRNRWLLAGLGLCLGALVVVWATQGRYAISVSASGAVYVLDTKTGQIWFRTIGEAERYNYAESQNEYFGVSHNCGTNENPKFEVIRGSAHKKVKDEP